MIRNPTKQAIFRLVIHLLKNCRKDLCEAIFYEVAMEKRDDNAWL